VLSSFVLIVGHYLFNNIIVISSTPVGSLGHSVHLDTLFLLTPAVRTLQNSSRWRYSDGFIQCHSRERGGTSPLFFNYTSCQKSRSASRAVGVHCLSYDIDPAPAPGYPFVLIKSE
jgi:hypothetical protein